MLRLEMHTSGMLLKLEGLSHGLKPAGHFFARTKSGPSF